MSKAVEGAALLAGALAIEAVLDFGTLGAGTALAAFLYSSEEALLLGGISMEAGAIASSLTNNRGMGITTRQPAAYRQVIRGQRRVGGISIYESTTGSETDQYNYVIVIAGHEVDSLVNLYLDGRQVYWLGSGPGYSVRNGVGFGGVASNSTYTGPDGTQYNFGGTGHSGIYCEARYGDQLPGDVIGGLTANDPNWAADGEGNSPWVGGCCYIYLKVEYNPTLFPNAPEIRLTVRGKNDIYDIRTGTRGFSTNPALLVADVITDPQFGLGDVAAFQDAGSQAQLIAAANICDEQVTVAALGLSHGLPQTESRYTAHYVCDTATAPGNVIDVLLASMGGRISQPGGEWYIFPAAWIGPTLAFDENSLAGPIEWNPYRSQRDLGNRVSGTYIAPNYPWNIAGNLYDSNGFYDGHIQNNFPFAYQPTDYPPYAADALHGYASDAYLEADSGLLGAWSSTETYGLGDVVSVGTGTSLVMYKSLIASNHGNNPATTSAPLGEADQWDSTVAYTAGELAVYSGVTYIALASTTNNEPDTSPASWAVLAWQPYSNLLPRQLSFSAVCSVTQAQRLAKIELLRNRFQGSGSFPCQLSLFSAQCCDTVQFTFGKMGWSSKLLEVVGCTSSVEMATVGDGEDEHEVPMERFSLKLAETDPSIYAWDPDQEELTVYDVPASASQTPRMPAPPTGMSVTSGASTALVALDGAVTPRAEIQWTPPADVLSTLIDVQYALVTGSSAGPWIDFGQVSSAVTSCFVTGVVAGQTYNFRICSLRASGAASSWAEVDGVTISKTLSIASASTYLAPAGTLVAEAFAPAGTGSATILVEPFTATLGGASVACLPAGEYAITGLAQQTLYYVYYVDPTFAGGAITPIATTNQSDYAGKLGYFLIGTIVTPLYVAGAIYVAQPPSSYSDTGTRTTVSPANAYDGSAASAAIVSGYSNDSGNSFGNCTWSGWPAVVTSAAAHLYVNISSLVSVIGSFPSTESITVTSSLGAICDDSSGPLSGVYSIAVPVGTDLSTITVTVNATTTGTSDDTIPPPGGSIKASASVFEIYVAP